MNENKERESTVPSSKNNTILEVIQEHRKDIQFHKNEIRIINIAIKQLEERLNDKRT